MANFGGPSSAFEASINKSIAPTLKRLTRLENKIHTLLVASMQRPQRNAAYWNTVRREIDVVYAQMMKVFTSYAQTAIPIQYRRTLANIQTRIAKNKAIVNQARRGITQMINSRATSQIVAALWSDASDSFIAAALTGKRNVHRFTRVTQQALVNEALLDADIALAFQEGNLQGAISTITSRFSTNANALLVEKQYVQAGAIRMRASAYAKMVVRTKFHEAASAAAVQQARNHGTSLVQVSTHNTRTPVCLPFEGKIFSLGGDDRRFPALGDVPPFHPNCLHLILPTFESALESQGTLQEFSDFSKGKSNRPPVPAGFIPISEREIA